MEEADILSDRIAVIVDGQIKCIGTPLFLKNNYGDGYRLNLIIFPDVDPMKISQFIKKRIPGAILIDESGGSLVFGVSIENMKQLGVFFKIMENDEIDEEQECREFKRSVKDWVSHKLVNNLS